MPSLSLANSVVAGGLGSNLIVPSFRRDFDTVKTLNHGIGPDITYTRTGGSASYFDSSGVIQFVSAGTGAEYARFDHDPSTLASKGLLIEEGRTNSIRNSQAGGAVAGTAGTAPTNWPWSGSTGGLTRTITTGSAAGFNYIDVNFAGTPTSSFQIIFDAEASSQVVAASGQTWTMSAYLALVAGTAPDCLVGIREALSDGTFVVAGSTNVVSSLTSTLQRFSHSRTLTDATTARVNGTIRVSATNGVAINFTLRIAAPQLEQGAFATSYIPTTNAAVTRGADSAVVTPISSFYNQDEGTLFAEASRPQVVKNVTFMAFTDGANANNVSAVETGVAAPTQQRFQVTSSGTAIAQLLYSAAGAANTVYKMIGTYAANDFIAAQNGVLTSPDASGTTPTTMTRLSIGLATTDTNAGYSNSAVHIRKIAYYPKRLSNERLRSLTV